MPHLKIYTKIPQLSLSKKATGGGNEVNDARKRNGNSDDCATISKGAEEAHKESF